MARRALLLAVALLCSAAWCQSESPKEAARRIVNQGTAFYHEGKLDAARSSFSRALELAPGYGPATQWMAVVCHRQGDLPGALPHYWAVQRSSLPALPESASPAQVAERELLVECEAILVIELNKTRIEHKLPLCVPHPLLAIICRQHSEEMRDLGYFAHESPVDGFRTILERFRQVFPDAQTYSIAENIARRYGTGIYSLTTENARRTHGDWINSPGHRANILTEKFTHVGIGLSLNANGDYWATQFFARF